MNNIRVVDFFIEEEDIKSLISEIESPSEVNPYPDFYSNRNGGTSLPYNKLVIEILKKYANKANKLHAQFNNLDYNLYTTKAYSSKWVKGQSGGPHVDDVEKEEFVQYSTVVYLNESPEFTGGTIYFPERNFEYTPIKASALFFPQQDKSYIHGITEVTSGTRYTIVMHHCSDISFADPDLL